MTQYAVRISENQTTRVWQETAAYDYDVLLPPGTYPLSGCRSDGKPDSNETPYYWHTEIPSTRVQQSLDGWHKAGEKHTYHVYIFGYLLTGGSPCGWEILSTERDD